MSTPMSKSCEICGKKYFFQHIPEECISIDYKMKLPESQAKALEEAAYKSEHDREYGNSLEERMDAFKAGANYQHPISYAKGIQDVIEVIRTKTKNGEKEIDSFLQGYFYTELKRLDKGE